MDIHRVNHALRNAGMVKDGIICRPSGLTAQLFNVFCSHGKGCIADLCAQYEWLNSDTARHCINKALDTYDGHVATLQRKARRAERADGGAA